ncbi:MAG: hypothetical protein NTV84_09155 [Methanoregula sp.]|nr:hypothetical protein [Methanoregula sp.]
MATARNGSGAISHGRHRLNSTPREDQHGDVMRAGAEARTSEHDRASAVHEVSHGYGAPTITC